MQWLCGSINEHANADGRTKKGAEGRLERDGRPSISICWVSRAADHFGVDGLRVRVAENRRADLDGFPAENICACPLREKRARLFETANSKRSVPAYRACYAERRNACRFVLFALSRGEPNLVVFSRSPPRWRRQIWPPPRWRSKKTSPCGKNHRTAVAYQKQAGSFKIKIPLLATQDQAAQ